MHKKFSLLLLSIILFLGAFLPEGKSSAASGSVSIAVDSLNVRTGPGLSYPLLKQVNRGETFPIVKEQGEWIQIQVSFAKTGWVVNWLVTKDNEQTAKAVSSSGQSAATANSSQLRIRTGPGTSFRVIGSLTKRQAVKVIDQNENWYKISSMFGEGWVAKEFIDLKTAGQQENSSTTNAGNKTITRAGADTGSVIGDTLNVRQSPDAASPVIGKLTKGTSVAILSQQNKWVQVSYLNVKGWVSAEFINLDSEVSKDTAKSKQTTSMSGFVTADSLRVRSGATLNSSVIGTITRGQRFTIVEENNNWAKIELKSGSFGWVSAFYLDKSGTKTSSDAGQTVKESAITILQNGTNIRKSPSVQSDVAVRANEGETYSVNNVQNDWYEIKLKDGSTAYVAGWVVSSNGSAPQIEKAGAEGYLKNKTIVLDPGHGGGDNGTTGANGTLEKDLTLRTARLLYDKLKAAGANVYLTRNNDSFISLQSRVGMAHSYNADAFVSLHYDSDLDRSVRGMTGYYYHVYQRNLADTLYNAAVGQAKLKNRGVRIGDYHVIRENNQKAVLMELGYLSNPEEEMTLNSSTYQENAASGLYEGLARYFKAN